MSYFRRPEQKHQLRMRVGKDALVETKVWEAIPFNRAKTYLDTNLAEESVRNRWLLKH